jgi:hypothetical protein
MSTQITSQICIISKLNIANTEERQKDNLPYTSSLIGWLFIVHKNYTEKENCYLENSPPPQSTHSAIDFPFTSPYS